MNNHIIKLWHRAVGSCTLHWQNLIYEWLWWVSPPVTRDTGVQFPDWDPIPSVLWRCWLGGRKGIWPVKNWVVGCWRGYLGWGADLHIAQQMPLPLTISCSSKSRLVLTFLFLPFWYLLTQVVPDKLQKSSKMVVCVCGDLREHLQM